MIFLILKIVLSFQILDRSGINRAAVERPNCPTADNAEFGKQRYDAHIPQSARNRSEYQSRAWRQTYRQDQE